MRWNKQMISLTLIHPFYRITQRAINNWNLNSLLWVMSDFKWNKKCIYRTYALKQQQLNNSSVLFSKKYFIVLGQKPLGKHNPLFLQRCSWEQEHTKYMSNDNHRNWLCALYDLTRVYFYFYFILYQFINHALISLQVRACPGTLLIG